MGIAVVAVGRLEKSFPGMHHQHSRNAGNCAFGEEASSPTFSERVKIWKQAFKESARLTPLVNEADQFIADLGRVDIHRIAIADPTRWIIAL